MQCGKKEVLGTFWASYSENSLAQQERVQWILQTKWRKRDHFSESLSENRAREESSLKLNIRIQTDIWHIRRGGACIGGIPLNIFSGSLGDGVAHRGYTVAHSEQWWLMGELQWLTQRCDGSLGRCNGSFGDVVAYRGDTMAQFEM